MTPTEKHRETALDLILGVQRGFTISDLETTNDTGDLILNRYADAISAALAKAEREGMKRAAEIAREKANSYSNSRDMMQAVQEAAADAKAIEIADAILAEAGEG